MKLLYFLILVFFGCAAKKPDIKKASVSTASFGISTIVAVSCDAFHETFAREKKTKEVEGEDLQELVLLLSKFEKSSDTEIDVRGELLITENDNESRKFCFDRFGIFYDGTQYFKNKELLKFLLEKKLANSVNSISYTKHR